MTTMTEEDRKFILKLADHLKLIEAKIDQHKIDTQRLDAIEQYLGIGKFKVSPDAVITPVPQPEKVSETESFKRIINKMSSSDPICTITSISAPGSVNDMLESNKRQSDLRSLVMQYCKDNKVKEMTIFFKD